MRDPVPDIREIITDRKEAGGLPSSTFLNLAPEKQEKLLSAAVREFTERPYNEASINRIVREAGIPRGSFYMYFRDKEDLFHYLMEESINEMLMVFEEVLHSQGGDIFAALPAMYDHLRSRRSADRRCQARRSGPRRRTGRRSRPHQECWGVSPSGRRLPW